MSDVYPVIKGTLHSKLAVGFLARLKKYRSLENFHNENDLD